MRACYRASGGTITFNGDVVLAPVLGGYLWRRGDWTLEAYAGAAYEDHDISPLDPANAVSGDEAGFLGQLAVWRNLGPSGFVSFDASYSSAFDSHFALAKLGRRFAPKLSAGL
jgi:hypothetical protein